VGFTTAPVATFFSALGSTPAWATLFILCFLVTKFSTSYLLSDIV
jgi:hypothetical protein